MSFLQKKERAVGFTFFLGCSFWFFNSFVLGLGYIPSSSMHPTLQVNDAIVRNKVAVGGKTSRFFSLPFLPGNWGLYIKRVTWPQYRVAGSEKLKRGDVVTFYPSDSVPISQEEKDLPLEMRTEFVKRFVAKKEDIVEIKEGLVYVNGQEDPNNRKRQYNLEAHLTRPIDVAWLTNQGITVTAERDSQKPEGEHVWEYEMTVNYTQLKALKKWISDNEVTIKTDAEGRELLLVRKTDDTHRSLNDMVPLTVPYEGMTILLNEDTHPLLIETVKSQEPSFEVREIGSSNDKCNLFYLNGVKVKRYTFKKDCCFLMGDNFHDSLDSRYFGLLEVDNINSRVSRVCFNWRDMLGGNFSRFFKRVE